VVDARPPSEWHETHISGSVSLPYYDIEWRSAELPRDGTWLIAYCTCPTHLAAYVVNYLRSHGFPNSGVLDGGLHAWVGHGYPISSPASEPRARPAR
jgi:rhodanese-related sulfurtransferase